METIGDSSEAVDAELIFLAYKFIESLGLKGYNVHINSIGDQGCRPAYLKALKDYYKNRLKKTCANCKIRFKENILRLLDCKEETCKEITKEAPQFVDFLDEECHAHFKHVLEFLDEAKVPYILNPHLVRGLDYYTGNVFEMYDLNPQNTRAMFGGGRYDDLVETFTRQKLTGTGFGWGDISMQLFLESWNLLPKFENSTQYLVTLWPQNGLKYFEASNKVAELLRSQGNTVEMWLKPETSISKQISYASKLEIKNVVIVGDEELQTNSFTTKDLITGEQTKTKLS